MRQTMSVVLNVEDVDRSAAFYESLGFHTHAIEYEGYRLVEAVLGRAAVALAPKRSDWMDEETREWLAGPLGNGVVLNFHVDDLDAAWERAQDADAPVEMPLREQPWGERAFMVDDPDGYVLLFDAQTRPLHEDAAEGAMGTAEPPT